MNRITGELILRDDEIKDIDMITKSLERYTSENISKVEVVSIRSDKDKYRDQEKFSFDITCNDVVIVEVEAYCFGENCLDKNGCFEEEYEDKITYELNELFGEIESC